MVNKASWLPGVGRTRRTTSRTSMASCPENAVKDVSATSAPETSGVDSQYGIGVHAVSSIASIAARIFLSCRAVTENRTFNVFAVASTARE